MIAAENIILGTVQFGINYGISNTTGQIAESEAQKLLDYAATVGIRSLDTAAAYGNAEEVIGRYHTHHPPFNIITKFDKGTDKTWKDSIERSIKRLNVPKVQTAMFHSFAEYKKKRKVFYRKLFRKVKMYISINWESPYILTRNC